MNVLLYCVGRNLNRAYRTCESFGVERLLLLECSGAHLAGSLYSATGRVAVEMVGEWPGPDGLLALETRYKQPLWRVDWRRVDTIAIGGETAGLPAGLPAEQTATIFTIGHLRALTVEAALAIALYEWTRNCV